MVAQVGALRVAIGADITGLQTGMQRAQREVSRGAASMQKSVAGISTSFRNLGAAAGLTLGAAGVGIAARTFLNVADASKRLASQLKLATAEYGSFAKANKDVRAIAEGTRSDLLATAELYSALQRNSGQLGATQQEVARATETVAKAFKISGAATSEQSAATRQLIQAFQSGVLRGDEFNSVMENAPRLAKLLADSLGVTVGELRSMAEAGELTANKLLEAFSNTKFTDGIDAEFKQLPVTFDEAMGQVYNAAIITFGAFDRGGQFSTSIANFVTDGTKGFKDLEDAAFNFGRGISDLFAALEEVRSGIANMHGDGIAAFSGMNDWGLTFKETLRGILALLDHTIETYARLANAPGNALWGMFGRAPVVYDSRFAENFDARTADKRSGSKRFSQLFRGGSGKTPPPFVPPRAKSKGGKGPKGRAASRDRSADVEFQFSEEMRRVQMSILQAQRSLSNNYQERARISLQILELEKADEQAELDNRVRKAERDFAEKKITEGALAEVKAQAATLALKNEELNQLEQQKITDEVRYQQAQDAAQIELTKLEIREEQLQAESQLATTASEQRDIQLRLLDISTRIEKARLETVLADEQSSDAAKEDARLRLAALSQRTATERQGVMNSTQGPWDQFLTGIPDTVAKTQEAMESLKVQGINGVIDSLVALQGGFGDMRDVALSAIKQITAELIRMQLLKMVAGLFGSVGGTTTASVSGGGSFNSTLLPGLATGGSMMIGGRGGIDRNILSMNGLPIARVSRGEQLNISPSGGGSGGNPIHIHMSGPMSDSQARRTGMQAAAGARAEMARSAQKGL